MTAAPPAAATAPALHSPATPDSAPPPAEDIVAAAPLDSSLITPDSLLPKPSYEGIPGWLTLGIHHPRFKPGDIIKGKIITEPTVIVDSGIAVFPNNDAWQGVESGTPLVFISTAGEKSNLFPDGQSVWDGDAQVVRVRARRIPNAVGWLVPLSKAADVTSLPISDTLSADGNTRTWTAGEYRIRVHRTGKLTGDVFAEARGMSAKREYGVGIDPASDSSMGVESEPMLDLKNHARVPDFFAAYSFAASGSTLLIYEEDGYECSNYMVVVFRPSRIDWISEPHYTGDCAH